MTPPSHTPRVSVVMACHNGAPFLSDAIASVLGQTHGDLELLLCDDASTDETPRIAAAWQARDPRIRLLRSERRSGPGAARNRGLEAASGEWIAVMDADDLLHRGRITGLLQGADSTGGDIVADDLVRFGAESGTLLGPLGLGAPWTPDATALLRAEGEGVHVGYLKPMIRRAALRDLRYREDLPIGEDFDLLLRLALGGARIAVLPEPWYLYRRHGRSSSHRMTPDQAAAIETAIGELEEAHVDWAVAAAPELRAWRARLRRARAFGELVRALKDGALRSGSARLARRPALAADLLRAATEGLRRRLVRPGPAGDGRAVILATQPVGGEGVFFAVPETGEGWDGTRAAGLARLTGSGQRHLRAVGRPGLRALEHVPGWRLAEIIDPAGGWTAAEEAQIAALTWPVLRRPEPATAPGDPGDSEPRRAIPAC
jgi:succinoglycan biosynthesis protein ExoO